MGNTVAVIDDGTKTYDIENKHGKKLCTFSFNPSDAGVVSRYKEVVNNLNSMGDRLGKNGKSNEEIAVEAEQYIKEQYDYLFCSDVSGSFFSIMSPLTILPSGKLFSQHVMEVIGKLVEEETGQRLKKLNIRINKYTKKYHD